MTDHSRPLPNVTYTRRELRTRRFTIQRFDAMLTQYWLELRRESASVADAIFQRALNEAARRGATAV